MDMFREDWLLIGLMILHGDENTIILGRYLLYLLLFAKLSNESTSNVMRNNFVYICFLLVLETSRVEIGVLSNELAHFTFHSSNGVCSNLEIAP